MQAFITSLAYLRLWLVETHFFPIPPLSAPALTMRIDNTATVARNNEDLHSFALLAFS